MVVAKSALVCFVFLLIPIKNSSVHYTNKIVLNKNVKIDFKTKLFGKSISSLENWQNKLLEFCSNFVVGRCLIAK